MDFLVGPHEGKEFHTEVTGLTHRDHREITELFSVHSVVKWLDHANGKTTP